MNGHWTGESDEPSRDTGVKRQTARDDDDNDADEDDEGCSGCEMAEKCYLSSKYCNCDAAIRKLGVPVKLYTVFEHRRLIFFYRATLC